MAGARSLGGPEGDGAGRAAPGGRPRARRPAHAGGPGREGSEGPRSAAIAAGARRAGAHPRCPRLGTPLAVSEPPGPPSIGVRRHRQQPRQRAPAIPRQPRHSPLSPAPVRLRAVPGDAGPEALPRNARPMPRRQRRRYTPRSARPEPLRRCRRWAADCTTTTRPPVIGGGGVRASLPRVTVSSRKPRASLAQVSGTWGQGAPVGGCRARDRLNGRRRHRERRRGAGGQYRGGTLMRTL